MSDSEREWGIPGDHVVHDEVFAASAVPSLWDLSQYEIPKLWAMGVDGRGVTIAVNDTGYDPGHPDMPKAVDEWSFISGEQVQDRNGHGTWCAGRTSGRNGVGIAPASELIIAKVLSNGGSGSTSGINKGRVWAAKNGADVISESLGGPGGNRADIDSINEAYENGCSLVVCAAGNSGYNGSNTIGYPGRYLETYCVGSHNKNDQISNFSSGGRELDVATPGEQTVSCKPGGGYASMSGTSMATPFFAGLMALIIQRRRQAGFADLHGADEWRKFFSEKIFHDDKGEPGKDVRWGLGKPKIKAIIDWLKQPTWIVWFAVLVSLFGGSAVAQEQQASRAIPVVVIDAEAAEIIPGDAGVSVILDNPGTTKPAMIISTTAVNPLVRAYAKSNPFPPVRLPKVGEGRYRLDGAPGAEFTVEILATSPEWWSEYLTVKIGGQPPPVTDPGTPPPGDGRDWSEITAWALAHATPTADKATADLWRTELEAAAAKMTGNDMAIAQRVVGDARRKAFIERVASHNWNPFLTELDLKVTAAPPKSVAEYKGLVTAIAQGLKR